MLPVLDASKQAVRRGQPAGLRVALVLGVLALGLGGAGTGCGSRTGLFGTEPCALEGAERVCQGVCGEGVQRCVDGFFEECVVPPAVRRCTNACGTGAQTCENERWSSCEVPDNERPCTNVCGSGVQSCSDGVIGECRVPPARFPCQNACGSGTQECAGGRLGECDAVAELFCESACGEGRERCEEGTWHPCDAPQPRPPELVSVVRDFLIAHPDFELDISGNAHERGIVADRLGPDDKPVYQGNPRTLTTTGRENFDQWYRDVPGVNQTVTLDLPLAPSPEFPGFFAHDDQDFFPIDDRLFGNEGYQHNYHFTLEARTTFEYRGGETFSFRGDDDMWVFINRRLAIDLGGLHPPLSASVSLDAIAGSHGLERGGVYPLHFFFAERHTIQSTFNIETSIAEPGSCD